MRLLDNIKPQLKACKQIIEQFSVIITRWLFYAHRLFLLQTVQLCSSMVSAGHKYNQACR